jgi:MoxR-like ATPase
VDGIAIGASVRGSLALERAIRAWALLDGRSYATPVDVERLFLPIVLHRIVFTPSFVATAREIGWDAASDQLREQCLAIAPRPGAELEAVAASA